jgi:hypothetical protein
MIKIKFWLSGVAAKVVTIVIERATFGEIAEAVAEADNTQ